MKSKIWWVVAAVAGWFWWKSRSKPVSNASREAQVAAREAAGRPS